MPSQSRPQASKLAAYDKICEGGREEIYATRAFPQACSMRMHAPRVLKSRFQGCSNRLVREHVDKEDLGMDVTHLGPRDREQRERKDMEG